MKYLVDSVIIIDHLNNITKATQWIAKFHAESCLSSITRAEVLTGVDKQYLPHVKLFLDTFKTLPITQEDADLAAELRREHRWKLPDAMQAATAINHRLNLIPRNTKDFDAKLSFVHIPYKI